MDTPIRSRQRVIVTVLALLFGPVFMLGPAAFGLWLLIAAGPNLGSAAAMIATLIASGLFAYHMLQNFQWVEFDGTRIRARRFWTRQLVEHAVTQAVEAPQPG
jgi:hypothetical protein